MVFSLRKPPTIRNTPSPLGVGGAGDYHAEKFGSRDLTVYSQSHFFYIALIRYYICTCICLIIF